jgi:hypothetical protein
MIIINDKKTYFEVGHLKYFFKNTDIGKEFLKAFNIYNVEKCEKPDFILIDNFGNKFGMEITTISEKTRIAKLCLSLDNVVQLVFKKIDNELNSKYFISLICLEKNINKIKYNESKLANQIFEIIKQGKNNVCDTSIKKIDNVFDFQIENGIFMTLIYDIIKEKNNFGGASMSCPVSENPILIIQSIINKKNKKLCSYSNSCKAHFLLIVSDPFIEKGNYFFFDQKLYEQVFDSNFSKVFLLELGGRSVGVKAVELKTK